MNLLLIITAMLVTALVTARSNRLVTTSPLFWLPLAFCLYGIWFSVSDYIFRGRISQLSEKVMELNAVAFFICVASLVFVTNVQRFMTGDKGRVLDLRSIVPVHLESVIFILVSTACWASLIFILGSGATTKRELLDNVVSQTPFITLPWSAFTVMGIRQLFFGYSGRPVVPFSRMIVIGTAVFAWLIMGERNFLFGFGVAIFLIHTRFRPVRSSWLLYATACVALVALVPITQSAKSVLLGQSHNGVTSFEDVYGGEFAGPGRNLSVLLNYGAPINTVGTLQKEASRTFSLGFLGQASEGLGAWYNRVYRPAVNLGGRSGWGFTLVGAGWLAGGVPGIIAYFMFFGSAVGLMYNLSKRSEFWFFVFIIIAPVCIYVIRQDMSFFVSSIIKQTIVPLFVLYSLNSLISRVRGSSEILQTTSRGVVR